MVQVVFVLPDESRETHEGRAGDTVMDVALDNGVPGIIAQCGGGCTCCTCHCWIGAQWFGMLPEPHADEVDMLEYAWGVNTFSRLACQIPLDEKLDGIEVTIPEQQA